MPNNPSTPMIPEDQPLWDTGRQPVGCPQCKRTFLVLPKQLIMHCPLCHGAKLVRQPVRMRPVEPEKMLPFRIMSGDLAKIFERVVNSIWIRPDDFNVENLHSRSVPIFWPLWLVDSDVKGHWQMEAGFDYQVESYQEVYVGGDWNSRKKLEGRVRWEPRLGTVQTHVDNVSVPALEEHANRIQMTSEYELNSAQAFDPNRLGDALLEAPDLPPEDAWPLAKLSVNQAAGRVCQQAASAQYVRNFSIAADYQNLNWTQFLLPMYATYYIDDDGNPQTLIVNGVSGTVRGPRLASRKRGGKIGGILGIVAAGLFLLALLGFLLASLLPAAAVIGALLVLVSIGLGIGAVVTAVWPGQWNQKQTGPKISRKG
ncbi:hypothetical protein KQH62_04610 [bacterium]|nr:hypothetical protein [bacterium]